MYFYVQHLRRGGITPNIITWLIWAIVHVINLVSYLGMSRDWFKSAVSIVHTVPTLIILRYIIGIVQTVRDPYPPCLKHVACRLCRKTKIALTMTA